MTEPIWLAALELARPQMRGKRIRLVGITASNLGAPTQLNLFEPDDDRRRRAVEAADELRERFGTRAVTRARLLRTGIPAPFERDLGTPVEQRGLHAEGAAGSGRRRRMSGAAGGSTDPAGGPNDNEADTDELDSPFEDDQPTS
jgi:hypothetical protein